MHFKFKDGNPVFGLTCWTVSFFLIWALMINAPAFADPVTDAIPCNLSGPAPVVQGNVLFTAYADQENESMPGGHVTAIRMYDPVDPGHTEKAELWDAGDVLNKISPNDRSIYFPQMTVSWITDVTIATGDGITTTFSGTLQGPILATTVRLTDQQEIFCDVQPNDLNGDFGGKGSLNRMNGMFEVTFNEPPENSVPIQCSYACYTVGSSLVFFNDRNVTNRHLALDDIRNNSDRLLYDLDGDGTFTESDGDWLVQWVRGFKDGSIIKKDRLLGAVDRSVPAVAVPPGRPHWYYGTQVTEQERNGYDAYVTANRDRRTVLYVGSKDGMLHAFDSGKFCWKDNPETAVVENRGYFQWRSLTRERSFNERWNHILACYPDSPPDFRWQGTKDGDKAPDYGTGEELWAFIPPNLLPMLKNNLLNAEGKASLDASPSIGDVYTHGAWRTVLMSAEGNGGSTIFCLDITDPEHPVFLWEFSDPDISTGPYMPGTIPMGRIAFEGKDRWAAFLKSGKPRDRNMDPSVYFIDIADGSLIRRVFLHAGMDNNGDHLDDGAGGVPGGAPVVMDSDGNGYIDRMYMGTDKGFVFKITIPDDPMIPGHTIRQCVINTDFYYEDSDGYTHFVLPDRQYQPIHHSPAVSVEHHNIESGETEYAVRIFFGTSDNPYDDAPLNTADTFFSLFAYTDRNTKDDCYSDRVVLDWYKSLSQGHRAFAAPFSAAGTVYFGTATWVTADPCLQGNHGRIYALNLVDGKVIHEAELGDILTSPLVEDEHLYFKTSLFRGKNPITLGEGRYNNDAVKGTDARNGIRAWKEIW